MIKGVKMIKMICLPSEICLKYKHVLLVQFHLRHSNGVKCLKLGSADIELWRSERKTTCSGRSFPIRISTSSCQDDNNLKQKWLLLILPRQAMVGYDKGGENDKNDLFTIGNLPKV
jgi:hypothetical protein